MKWALFFAPVAVSAAVMLFASVVLTEDAEAPRRANLFERDSESEPDVELEPAGLFVQGPDAEAPREGMPRARQLPERQPRRAPLGGLGSRRGRAMIPPPPTTISSRGGFDESESDDEADEDDEGLSPEERRAKTQRALRVIAEKHPNMENIPGLGVLKRFGRKTELEGETPTSEQEPAPASMGGAGGS